MPVLVIIAGANGSGKSSYSRFISKRIGIRILDPDKLGETAESGYSKFFADGRKLHHLVQPFLSAGESFGIETTLSGRTILGTMRRARGLGYEIRLVYILTQDVETNIARVALRVRRGGHDVAENDVRRRFVRSLANLPHAMKLSDFTYLLDNSSDGPGPEVRLQLLAIYEGWEAKFYSPLPSWATALTIPGA